MEEYSDNAPKDIARHPMVPIRDVVIFPFTKVAFKIGRPGSVRALEEALASASHLQVWTKRLKERRTKLVLKASKRQAD